MFKLSKRPSPLPLLLIFLGGFALRLFRLGAQSLWYDETVSAVLARQSIPELAAHTARDIHPPGYYLLLHGWSRLAGDSEFALAFFSLGFGMLLVAGVYRLGKRLAGRPAALWGAGLAAFSPYNVWYSQEARMYTLAALLGVGAVYWLWRGISPVAPKRGGASPWLFYAVASAGGMYALYYFAFLLAALNLFAAAALALDFGASPAAVKQRARNWLLANLGAAALYLPWLGIAWRQATNPPVPPWRSDIPLWRAALESWSALSLGESVEPGQAGGALLITLALFGLGLMALNANRKRALLPWLTFGPLAIILILPRFTGSPLYHVRYLFTYSSFFYVTLGAGLARLWTTRRAMALLASLALAGGAAFSLQQMHANPRYAADDLRGAVRFIEDRWRPGDVILVNAGYTYTALQYYLTGPAADYRRLTDFEPQASRPDPLQPPVLQTGAVDGPPSLGWGDPASDFYAMPRDKTVAALEAVSEAYPRLWLLRAYDTVTDPDGVIRRWLSENMRQFEDYPVSGPSNFRVQGFLSRSQPPPPPGASSATFGDRFQLRGFTPPAPAYRAGETIHVVLWLAALADVSAEPPYALSLKLWDSEGKLAAQVDEWPAGSLYFTPAWPPGEAVRYPLGLALPANIAPGPYWLDAAVYRPDNGLPLAVAGTGQSSVTLGGIQVSGRDDED